MISFVGSVGRSIPDQKAPWKWWWRRVGADRRHAPLPPTWKQGDSPAPFFHNNQLTAAEINESNISIIIIMSKEFNRFKSEPC
jgi:hypothetical protein